MAWPLAMQIGNLSGYAEVIRLCIPCSQVAPLDVVPDCMPRRPAKLRSFTSLQMVHTHNYIHIWYMYLLVPCCNLYLVVSSSTSTDVTTRIVVVWKVSGAAIRRVYDKSKDGYWETMIFSKGSCDAFRFAHGAVWHQRRRVPVRPRVSIDFARLGDGAGISDFISQ